MNTSIRTASIRRVIDLLRADPDNAAVTIGYGDPPENMGGAIGDGAIFARFTDGGETEVVTMQAGRHQRSDRWRIEFWCLIHHSGDESNGLETAELVERLYASIENLLADNPTLAVDGSGLPGLVSCVQSGTSDGDTFKTEHGFAGWWHCFADCEARLL